MLNLTWQNVIEALGCPKDYDISSIFGEIQRAFFRDSSHYKTIEGLEGLWTVTIIKSFMYKWKAGQEVHSEQLYCYETYKVPYEMYKRYAEYEDLDFETFVIENCPLILREYYI